MVITTACFLVITLGCSPQQQGQLQQELNSALSRVTVGNTTGQGVYLRRTPHDQDKLKAWPDGTVLTVVSQDVESESRTWKHVRDPDGNVGYVPAEYTLFLGVNTAEAQRLADQVAAQADREGLPEKIGSTVSGLLRTIIGAVQGPGTGQAVPALTTPPTKPKLVPNGLIERTWLKLGGDAGPLGSVNGDENAADESPFGTTGAQAGFEHGHIYWSKTLGAHVTLGAFDVAHVAQLRTKGWLGFPIDDEHAWHGERRMNFEGGYIHSDGRSTRVERYNQNSVLETTGDTNALDAELRERATGKEGVPTAEVVLLNPAHPIWRVVRITPSGSRFLYAGLPSAAAFPPCSTGPIFSLNCSKAEVSLGRVPLVPGNELLLVANGDPIHSADKDNIWLLQLLYGGEFFWRAVFGAPLPYELGDGAITAAHFSTEAAFKAGVQDGSLPPELMTKLGALKLAFGFHEIYNAVEERDPRAFVSAVDGLANNEAVVAELQKYGYGGGPLARFVSLYGNALRIERLLELSEVVAIEKLMGSQGGMVGLVTAKIAE